MFTLAPMSGLIRTLTYIILPIPPLMAVLALTRGFWPLLLVAGFMALIYLSVWLWWRPSRFEVVGGNLVIVFPLRQRATPLTQITGVRKLFAPSFKQEFGWAARVGAGGLWGGFGWLWTQRRGMVEMYISKQDDYVFIERRDAPDLLLTPTKVDRFITAIAPR